MKYQVPEDVIWIWLSQLGRPVNRIADELIRLLGSAKAIWNADCKSALPDPVLKQRELTARLLDAGRRERAAEIYERTVKDGGWLLHTGKEKYPPLLKEIYAPPLVLYGYGKLPPQGMPLLAMVGSRNCSFYGRSAVYKLASELAYCGIGIVSGLAKGIDARAHEGAIAGNGYTLGVLGGGADVIYPYENIHLYYKVREYGCVLSEYPPGTQPLRHHFPARNRIIAGLTFGTFVCEAAKSSGTMITVERAIEENRQVYALPGNIDSEFSEGTNQLIKNCAVCVTDYRDILEDIGFEPKRRPPNSTLLKLQGLEGNVRTVAEAVSKGCSHADAILEATGLSPESIQTALTILEVKGIIRRNPKGGFYVI